MVDVLDASKPFDRVKHSILFQKLIDKGILGYNVQTACILVFELDGQTICLDICLLGMVCGKKVYSHHAFLIYVRAYVRECGYSNSSIIQMQHIRCYMYYKYRSSYVNL